MFDRNDAHNIDCVECATQWPLTTKKESEEQASDRAAAGSAYSSHSARSVRLLYLKYRSAGM